MKSDICRIDLTAATRYIRAMNREEVGKRLQALRQSRGLKHHEMAEALDVGVERWKSWAVGRIVPPVEYGEKIGALFGVTLDYLYLGATKEPGHLSPQEQRILTAFRVASAEGKLDLMNLAFGIYQDAQKKP